MLETDKFENIKQYKETLQSSGKEYTVYNIQKVCEDFGVDIQSIYIMTQTLINSLISIIKKDDKQIPIWDV